MNKVAWEKKQAWCYRIGKLGITQKEFCEQAGVKYETFKRIRNPTFSNLEKIEKALIRLEESHVR